MKNKVLSCVLVSGILSCTVMYCGEEGTCSVLKITSPVLASRVELPSQEYLAVDTLFALPEIAVHPAHPFSPVVKRGRTVSNGTEVTVFAGLVRRSTFGSTGSLLSPRECPVTPLIKK